MIIQTQDRLTLVNTDRISDITVENCGIVAYYGFPINLNEESPACTLAIYENHDRAKEVLNWVLEAFGNKWPVFKMPEE